MWRYNHAKRYTYANAIKQWINDQFHMNMQTKPLHEFYIHSLLSSQVVESFFQNQSNNRNWFSALILIPKQGNSDANNYGTINNGYFTWCTFESFCHNKKSKNQSLLLLKKNPHLARIFSFSFCYQLNITKYDKRNVIIVFYCLLIFMHSRKKVENGQKLVANLV